MSIIMYNTHLSIAELILSITRLTTPILNYLNAVNEIIVRFAAPFAVKTMRMGNGRPFNAKYARNDMKVRGSSR